MAFESVASIDPAVNADGSDANATYATNLQAFVYALFFAFGGITSLNDVLIPKLKALFTLKYGEVMLVQFAFFLAYFIISIPAAALVRRIGYMRSAVVGLLTMTVGCLLFIPASSYGLFGLFLMALFVLASGITTVQVVANPLISMLGPVRTASSRLTFAQAFNSLGTTLFPYVGSILILGSPTSVSPSHSSCWPRSSGCAARAWSRRRPRRRPYCARSICSLGRALPSALCVFFCMWAVKWPSAH